jgi:6-phosphogluconolactonase (cycloisomerase 2 family)
MFCSKSILKMLGLLAAATALELLGLFPQTNAIAQSAGDVYVLSNSSDGNAVIVFHRNESGTLEPAGRFSTGGNGTGSRMSSQGAVILGQDNRMLFAVNAGSNSISAFSVSGDTLTLLQTIPSGGENPVSLTVRGDLLYVLNAGETPDISGFRIVPEESTRLVPIEGSTQALPGGAAANPAEVSFTPEGSVLVVTERGTSQFDSFTVSEEGRATSPQTYSTASTGPFGFQFAHNSVAIVAYTSDSAFHQGGAGSYKVTDAGQVDVITPDASDNQTASSWMAVPINGRFAFTSNVRSGTISSFAVAPDSSISLLQPVAASLRAGDGEESAAPSDLALSTDSRFLYVRNAANGTISGFMLHEDGSLTPVTRAGELPESAAGLAAR